MTFRHSHTRKSDFASTIRHALLAVWIGIVVFVAMVTIFAGYAGAINTMTTPFAGVAAMTFIGWWMLNLMLLAVNALLCRKLALPSIAAILATLKPFLVFCPLNIFHRAEINEENASRSFSLLSYNVAHMQDSLGMASLGYNRTMSHVLQSGADVVCMMEYTISPKNLHPAEMTAAQFDSLQTIYPYHETYAGDIAIFSKTPVKALPHPQADQWPRSGQMGAYEVTVCGRKLTLIPVHLCSIGLNEDDKDLYRDLVDSPSEIRGHASDMRHKLVEKLYRAFQQRLAQVSIIRDFVAETEGPVIVCGDFNDVPNCYAIRTLQSGAEMTDAYSQVGIGAKITFNAPLFFFRIDHVLYRGDLTPVSMTLGNVASSDHYPWLTTFVWNEPQRGTND
jgi:endonuclease/exonuclease/phosphatase (EEP) superfamily protein YafD